MSANIFLITKETNTRSVPFYNVSRRGKEEICSFLNINNREGLKDKAFYPTGNKLFIVEVDQTENCRQKGNEEKDINNGGGDGDVCSSSHTKNLTIYDIKPELVSELTALLQRLHQ